MIKKYAAEISQYIEEPGYKAIYIYILTIYNIHQTIWVTWTVSNVIQYEINGFNISINQSNYHIYFEGKGN